MALLRGMSELCTCLIVIAINGLLAQDDQLWLLLADNLLQNLGHCQRFNRIGRLLNK